MIINRAARLRRIVLELTLILISLVILIPFYLLLSNSLKPYAEASQAGIALPSRILWENYRIVFQKGKILLGFFNSCLITISSLVVIIVITSAAAFIIQRRRDKVSSYLMYLVLIGIIVPISIVPMFKVMKTLALTGTYLSVIVIYVATRSPISVFLYFSYLKSISRDFDEAAIIDGCGQSRLFFQVIFPLLQPITVTVIVLNFMLIWNDFLVVIFFLSSGNKITLPLTVYFFAGSYRSQWNYIFADIILASLPVIALYFAAQRYIISGMTAGAVKS